MFLTLVIILSLVVLAKRQYTSVIMFCSAIICWMCFSIYHNYKQLHEKEILVFHVKKQSALALRVGNKVYGSFDNISNNDFEHYIKPYLVTISNLELIPQPINVASMDSTILSYGLNSNITANDINADFIIVKSNTCFDLTTCNKRKPIIIADCSNSYKFVMYLKKQCALLDIPFYSVKEQGAFRIKL